MNQLQEQEQVQGRLPDQVSGPVTDQVSGTVPGQLQGMVEKKWTTRAESYSQMVHNELNSYKKNAWLREILSQVKFDGRQTLTVLDIGTGPGFFAIILAQLGWKVKAVDCTVEMIEVAQDNAKRFGVLADFSVMDSHILNFPDNSFDLVLSRNVTWTLYDPLAAYKEWRRVLRPGGHLLIFDANWNRHLFDNQILKLKIQAEKEAFERFQLKTYEEPEPEMATLMYSSLPMGRYQRPKWDEDRLLELGFKDIFVDLELGRRVWDESEQVMYSATPLFMIKAVKA
jgi:ubiquinone/menaquinone biosynthesis C-methylase UbiE